MAPELKVTVFEPLKEPRTVSSIIDEEFVPLIDRGVVFNEDGSLCDDFTVFPEDLSDDEMIGFNIDCLPPATSSYLASIPEVSVKKQKKIERLKKIKETQRNDKLRNKLKKLRKKQKSNMAVQNGDLNEDFIALPNDPDINAEQHNLRGFQKSISQPVVNQPNAKARKKKNKKKAKPAIPPPNNAIPAFVRNSWKRPPPRNFSQRKFTANNLDYIPVRVSHPKFQNNYPKLQNNYVPPLTNNRYFNINS